MRDSSTSSRLRFLPTVRTTSSVYQIDDDVGGQRLRLKIDIQLLKSDVVKLYVCCLRINSVRIDDHRLSRR